MKPTDLIKQFGRTARGERLERIRKSPHFVNDKFQNEEPATLFTGQGGMLKNIGKFLFGKKPKNRIPKLGEVPVIKTDLNCLPESGDFYLWFGHSSFLFRLDGKTILADPVFYKGSPVSFVNRAFPGTDLYKPNDMPKEIDFLLISHDHWDHLDYKTVSELKGRVKKVVCPLGVGENFEYWGYDKQQLIELDWNESATSEDLTFHCLPTQHFSGRGFWKSKTMPASWLMESSSRKVFFSGDGGYSSRFKRFGEQFPDIDLAIMENGQYDANWSQIHTMPEQLGKAVADLGAKCFLTVHHSKFCLSNHHWDEPRKNERKAAEQYGLQLVTCQIGELFLFDYNFASPKV